MAVGGVRGGVGPLVLGDGCWWEGGGAWICSNAAALEDGVDDDSFG